MPVNPNPKKRPRKMSRKRTAFITVKTYPDVKRDLIRIALRDNRSLSDIAHELLDRYRVENGALVNRDLEAK